MRTDTNTYDGSLTCGLEFFDFLDFELSLAAGIVSAQGIETLKGRDTREKCLGSAPYGNRGKEGKARPPRGISTLLYPAS